MIINTGEYVHIIHRQLFREDAQRHFVGTVESHEGTIMRVKGYYQTVDLSTTYLGIKLRTPPVPSASPLSEEIDKIKQMEQAGASAVVLHLLFEEQMEIDPAASKPEFRVAPEAYLKHIAAAKSCVKIPIIASDPKLSVRRKHE